MPKTKEFVNLITEDSDELKQLMLSCPSVYQRERVQALYLLKSGQCNTLEKIARIIGRDKSTILRWLDCYRDSNLDSLLEGNNSRGRKAIVPDYAAEELKSLLSQSKSFSSYEEVRQWLEKNYNLNLKNNTVRVLVERLGHSFPARTRQGLRVTAFRNKKLFDSRIKEEVELLKKLMLQQSSVNAREKIQILYLLKSQQCFTEKSVAKAIGRSQSTVNLWLQKYRRVGLNSLLEE